MGNSLWEIENVIFKWKKLATVFIVVLIFQYHKVRMDGAKKLMNLH